MVGMQASLHTSMGDIETDLTMKKASDPRLSTDDMILNDDDEFGDSDEFGESDPEELRVSPPSNDSNQRRAASLDDADELGREEGVARASVPPASSGEFAEVFDQLNADNAERAQALKQQNVYSRQTIQSNTAPVKSAAPNVSPFGRR
jgi:hypothetical protein